MEPTHVLIWLRIITVIEYQRREKVALINHSAEHTGCQCVEVENSHGCGTQGPARIAERSTLRKRMTWSLEVYSIDHNDGTLGYVQWGNKKRGCRSQGTK